MSMSRGFDRAVRFAMAAVFAGAFGGCGSQQEIGMDDAMGRPLQEPPADYDPAQQDAPLLGSGPLPGGEMPTAVPPAP